MHWVSNVNTEIFYWLFQFKDFTNLAERHDYWWVVLHHLLNVNSLNTFANIQSSSTERQLCKSKIQKQCTNRVLLYIDLYFILTTAYQTTYCLSCKDKMFWCQLRLLTFTLQIINIVLLWAEVFFFNKVCNQIANFYDATHTLPTLRMLI